MFLRCISGDFFVSLYKKYISLKLRKLEKSPRFEVMSWQPF